MSFIDLEKREQKVGIILEKRNILKAPIVRVGMACDISGSTQPLYKDGHIQETVDRLLAIAGKFDDNGEMDMWSFTEDYDALEVATKDDYGSYVEKHILHNNSITKWGGTHYGPVMNAAVDFYFRGHVEHKGGFLGFGAKDVVVEAENTHIPALVLFITDGANGDHAAAAKILRDAQKYPLYWSMVGVGDPKEFGFLQQMADELPNVGFINMSSLKVSDDEIYEQLISEEFCTWVKNLKK